MGRVAIACLLALLALTNAWPGYEQALMALGQTDTASYRIIAEAAPGIPANPVDYHHAQRFWLHWIVGAVASATGLPADSLNLGAVALLLVGTLAVLVRVLETAGVPSRWQLVLAAAWIFNPYCVRFYLAAPWMGADVLFAFGFSIAVLGVLRGDHRLAALGLLVSAFGRQTSLALTLALWLAMGWRGSRKDVAPLAVASVLVIGVYSAGGWYASATGAASENLLHLTGLMDWLGSGQQGKGNALLEFFLRGVASQGAALAIVVALVARSPRLPRPDAWLAALLVLSVIAQPLVAGPEVTGNNIARLASLGGIGFVAIAALLARDSGTDLAPGAAWTAVLALFFGSMHHAWSWPGLWLVRTPEHFVAVLSVSCALTALAVYLGSRQVESAQILREKSA